MSRDPSFKPRVKSSNNGSNVGTPNTGGVGMRGEPTGNRVYTEKGNKMLCASVRSQQSDTKSNDKHRSKKSDSSQSISDILASLDSLQDVSDTSDSEAQSGDEKETIDNDRVQSARIRGRKSESLDESRGKRSTSKTHWKFPASDWCTSPIGKKAQQDMQVIGQCRIVKQSPAKVIESPKSKRDMKDELPYRTTEGNALWQLRQLATVGFVRPISFDIPGEWKITKKIKILAQKHAAKRKKREALKIEKRFKNVSRMKPCIRMSKLKILTVVDCSKRPKVVKNKASEKKSQGDMKVTSGELKKEPVATKRKREKLGERVLKKGTKKTKATPKIKIEEKDVIASSPREPAAKRQRKTPAIYNDFITPVKTLKEENDDDMDAIHEVDENLVRYKMADPEISFKLPDPEVDKTQKVQPKKGKENKLVGRSKKKVAQKLKRKLKQAEKVKQKKVKRESSSDEDENLIRYKIVKVQEIRNPTLNKQRKALLKKGKENVKSKKLVTKRLKRELQDDENLVRYKIITVKELRKPKGCAKIKTTTTKGKENKVRSSKILKQQIIKKLKQAEKVKQNKSGRNKSGLSAKNKVALQRGTKAGNAAKVLRGLIKQEKKNTSQKGKRLVGPIQSKVRI